MTDKLKQLVQDTKDIKELIRLTKAVKDNPSLADRIAELVHNEKRNR